MDKTGQEEITNHMICYKESWMSKKDYCEQVGINYWAFKRWCYSYGYEKKRTAWSQNGFI